MMIQPIKGVALGGWVLCAGGLLGACDSSEDGAANSDNALSTAGAGGSGGGAALAAVTPAAALGAGTAGLSVAGGGLAVPVVAGVAGAVSGGSTGTATQAAAGMPASGAGAGGTASAGTASLDPGAAGAPVMAGGGSGGGALNAAGTAAVTAGAPAVNGGAPAGGAGSVAVSVAGAAGAAPQQAGGAAGAGMMGSGGAGELDVAGASGVGTGGSGQEVSEGGAGNVPVDRVANSSMLAPTPPMGWNSWNRFKSDISDDMLRNIADAMVSSGMRDVGYTYVNIDDTWMQADGRENGKLIPDRAKFPNGMKALADYIHSLGLKLGIYGDRGTATCANIAESGSYGYEEVDAQTFADWGIDYLKYDNCNLPGPDSAPAVDDRSEAPYIEEDYVTMGEALKATGRPFIYSLCAWGWHGEWMINTGHLWRSTGDIADCWDNDCVGGEREEWENGVVEIIDMNADMAEFAGPDGWNDPDMLEVGNGNLSNTEYISHFSLWAIMAAPLIAGNDLINMSAETLAILTNEEAIAVDQDVAGIQGTRIVDDGDLEVWMKPLGSRNGTEKAVVLFNRSSQSTAISVDFSMIGIDGTATVRDLWAHEDLGQSTGSFSAEVASHGVVMVKIVQQP